MRTKLSAIAEAVRSGYWFIPTVLFAASAGLATFTLSVDRRYPEWSSPVSVLGRGPEATRNLLSTIAGSMITASSVVFSITMVVLTLASAQFGPRILRTFMRDRGTQITLGMFIGTFTYALVVLNSVRGPGEQTFTPSLSTLTAMLLVFASMGILIYFIHHVASAIQADNIIHAIARDLDDAIDRLYPPAEGAPEIEQVVEPALPDRFDDRATPVYAERSDYVQFVDVQTLFETACERDGLIEVRRRPGDFMAEGSVIARVLDDDGDDKVAATIRGAFILGTTRTLAQDAEFGIDQLVEIAVRALSPGVNDPFTATTCIDRLSSALAKIAKRPAPERTRCDQAGHVRVVLRASGFAGLVDAAFNQIRQNASATPAVLIRLLEAIETVALQTSTDDQREALRRHADLVQAASEAFGSESDRDDLHERYEAVLAVTD